MREMQFIMSRPWSCLYFLEGCRILQSATELVACTVATWSHIVARVSLCIFVPYLNKRLSTSTKPFAKAFQLFLKLYLLIQLILWIPNTHASRYEFCTTILQQPYRHYQVTKRYEKVIRGHVWTSVNHVNRNCLLHMLWFWQHHTLLFSNRSKRPAFVYKQIQQSAGIQPCFRSYAIHALLISSALKVCNFFNFSKRRLGHWSSIRMSSKLLRYYP